MKGNVMTKKYMSNNENFADLFNYTLYDGAPVIQPDNLRECDGNEIFIEENELGEFSIKDNQRDILKRCIIKRDADAGYILLGIENQSDIHYAMPVRNMLYDALNYTEQVNKKVAQHRRDKDLSGAEYISGFSKKDKIFPIVTQVVYFGAEEWDGPRTLHEMLDTDDDRIIEHISDYKLNLIIPKEIEDIEKFQSDFKYVVQFIKHSKDKEQLRKIMENNKEYFSNVPYNTALLLKQCANVDVQMKEERKINMCKAIDDMIEDARMEERKKADEQIEEERRKADDMIKISNLKMIINLDKKGLLKETDAAKELHMSLSQYCEKKKEYSYM